MTDELEEIFALAKEHGEVSEPDHEVGDLQDALHLAFHVLTPEQRETILAKAREEAQMWRDCE
jgi:MoaA/NifB/PqqE/SkfB family radical SAM enzyme